MAFMGHRLAWVIVALCFVTVSVFATFAASLPDSTTFRMGAFGDTTLSTASPDTVFGGASVLWVSKSGNAQNWSLISFDVGSKLLSSDVIISARVKLLVSQSTGTFPATIITALLLDDFTEATTTYNTRPAEASTPITATMFDKQPGPGKAVFLNVTPQLASWRQGGRGVYFGIQLTMSTGTANAAVAFASRENTYLEGPVLQVFTLPPGRSVYGYGTWQGGVFALRPSK